MSILDTSGTATPERDIKNLSLVAMRKQHIARVLEMVNFDLDKALGLLEIDLPELVASID